MGQNLPIPPTEESLLQTGCYIQFESDRRQFGCAYRMFATMVILLSTLSVATVAYARKTNQTVVEDPFDKAAGGATLTRATRENVMIANPALMPYGGALHRWLGTQFTFLCNKESIDFLRSMVQSTQSGDEAAAEEESSSDDSAELIERVFDTPIHAGMQNITGWTLNNFGVEIFARAELDIEANEFGQYGAPEVRFGADIYAGGAASAALRLIQPLSVGVTAKYLAVAEPDIGVSLLDTEEISKLSSAEGMQEAASYGYGLGYDGGALLFLQGETIDYRLAVKIEDFGNTTFTGTQAPFLQQMHIGTGVTFHNSVDSLHLAVDYRDYQAVYEEPMFKRVYAGARLSLREYVGLATGLYQGYPTFGARLDLIFFKLGITSYTKELGEYPGANPRSIYEAYFMTGF